MKKKKTKIVEKVGGKKRPIISESPQSYLAQKPTWGFCNFDRGHRKWGNISDHDAMLDKLISFERMTWDAIMKASGGRGAGKGNNNHYINVNDLEKEAQERFAYLKFDELGYDQVFSLRLAGKHRLFGLLTDGTFNIIWNDPDHEICKVKK